MTKIKVKTLHYFSLKLKNMEERKKNHIKNNSTQARKKKKKQTTKGFTAAE